MDKRGVGRHTAGMMTRNGADSVDLRNWQRRPDGITTSGALGPGDPARLAAIGVRHVINLALESHPEALADEAGQLARAGIGYTHIPVPFDAPGRAHLEMLRLAIDGANGPVHIHCIMNYRVTAFLYLLDIEAGVEEREAHARMAAVWDPLSSDDPAARVWKALLRERG